MKNRFKIICFLIIILAFTSFHVFAENEAKSGGTLRYGIGADLITFDMPNYRSSNDLIIGSLIFDTLVSFDNNMENYIPRLATSWERKDDLTWLFNLRKGVEFTDGTPFNAKAVKISLERASTALKGQRFHGAISNVKIIDDYTVEIELKERNAPFFPNLTWLTGAIFSPTALEKYGDDFYRNPVGTSRFKLEEWIPGTHVVLTRNENYWGVPAKLDKVVFVPIPNEASRVMSFKSGELDVIENLPPHEIPSIEADPNFKVMTFPQLRTVWVGFNCGDEILKNVTVRKAIAHAIDRKSIIEFTMENIVKEANLGLLPEQIMKTDPPLSLDYDPELSRKLLAEAGYENGLKLELWTPEGRYLKDVEIAQVVQEQLRDVGIDVSVRVIEYSSYIDAINRLDQQMFILGWGLSKNSDSLFRGCFHSASASNWVNYRDKELDKMIDETVKSSNEEEIKKSYYEMNKIIIENAVVFPIYYTTMPYGLSSKVEEFSAHPMEVLDLSKTWISD